MTDTFTGRYERARADFEALEALTELDDQVELDAMRLELMRNPTKALAARMYEAGVHLWLVENGPYYSSHPSVRDICERYGVT